MNLARSLRDLDARPKKRGKRKAPASPLRYLTTSRGRGWYVVAPGVMDGPHETLAHAAKAYKRRK